MFPDEFDHSAVESYAEGAVFSSLKQCLSSEYVVIHSLRWTPAPKLQPQKTEPEIDFLIMRVGWPILCIEVKGGLIEIRNKEWYQYEKRIEDPYQQAVDAKFSLINFIKSRPGYSRWWIPIECCLAFPDVEINPASYIADELVLDRYGLNEIEHWVEDAMKYALGREPGKGKATKDPIDFIVALFAQGRTARLFQKFQQQEREFAKLTETQFAILDRMRIQRRAVVAGCAGSGKTFLAIEKAKRLASKDLKVLLTCHNEELVSFLQEQLKEFPNVTVTSFERMCYRFAEKTGFGLDAFSHNRTRDRMDIGLPTDLEENIKTLINDGQDPRFDAVIVDEGQMFRELWWGALDKLLIDGEGGIRYIFYDNNQRVYKERDAIPGEENSYLLDENCRNTQYIHWTSTQFYQSDILPRCNRVQGLPVEVHEYTDSQDMLKKLSKILHTIIKEGQVSAKDVIVLIPRDDDTALGIRFGKQVGAFRLSYSESPDANCVRVTTVEKYRGLERKVVILADIDRRIVNYPEILYIGMSRARDHLVVLFSARLNSDIKKQILVYSTEPGTSSGIDS